MKNQLLSRVSVCFVASFFWCSLFAVTVSAGDAPKAAPVSKAAPIPKTPPKGTEAGWKVLGEADFADVNGITKGPQKTWTWKKGVLHCTGKPIGVYRSKKEYTNFELLLEWNHQKEAGNSGVFVWVDPNRLKGLKQNKLPKSGIEVQMLDHGYRKKRPNAKWFTTNGDVFAVGSSTFKAFPPTNGTRSFPKHKTTKGFGNWNSYYVRCVKGEVRLWVNGVEVSGGSDCKPCVGPFALEAEGSPIIFRNIRVRELP